MILLLQSLRVGPSRRSVCFAGADVFHVLVIIAKHFRGFSESDDVSII